MNSHYAIAGSALIASLLAAPVMAQPQNVCLQRQDIMSWKAYDENTITYTDRQGRSYTLKFRDGCPSGTRNPEVVYRNMKRSGCLAHGDQIDVTAGGSVPPPVCMVESVQEGVPFAPPVAGNVGGLSQRNSGGAGAPTR